MLLGAPSEASSILGRQAQRHTCQVLASAIGIMCNDVHTCDVHIWQQETAHPHAKASPKIQPCDDEDGCKLKAPAPCPWCNARFKVHGSSRYLHSVVHTPRTTVSACTDLTVHACQPKSNMGGRCQGLTSTGINPTEYIGGLRAAIHSRLRSSGDSWVASTTRGAVAET